MVSGDIMDNKGFTLVELLATVVILGLVMGIGAFGISNTINNSKKKSETIFIDKLNGFIMEYIEYSNLSNSPLTEIGGGEVFSFEKCYLDSEKCYDDENNQYIDGGYYVTNARQLESIKINDLKSSGLFDKEALINPANKLDCFTGINPEIKVFKDDDSVYYYYLNLENGNNTCEVSDDNLIISNLPDNLKVKVDDLL